VRNLPTLHGLWPTTGSSSSSATAATCSPPSLTGRGRTARSAASLPGPAIRSRPSDGSGTSGWALKWRDGSGPVSRSALRSAGRRPRRGMRKAVHLPRRALRRYHGQVSQGPDKVETWPGREAGVAANHPWAEELEI
jgi:hypothetical protein